MCEIRTTRVSVEHSWNAHGISGLDDVDAPGVEDEPEVVDDGILGYHR
jgi:hypothetical protein